MVWMCGRISQVRDESPNGTELSTGVLAVVAVEKLLGWLYVFSVKMSVRVIIKTPLLILSHLFSSTSTVVIGRLLVFV